MQEQEEAELVENERRRQYDAEMQRLEKEAEERERQRHLQEHQEIQKKVAKERLEQLKSTQIGEKAFEGMTEDVSFVRDILCFNFLKNIEIDNISTLMGRSFQKIDCRILF